MACGADQGQHTAAAAATQAIAASGFMAWQHAFARAEGCFCKGKQAACMSACMSADCTDEWCMGIGDGAAVQAGLVLLVHQHRHELAVCL